MKNPRKTVIYLFLIFHLLHFIGALYIDSRQDDLGFLLSIKGYLPWMKYFALSGLVLFLVAYIVVLRDSRILRKSINLAKEEHTSLKAKLFDFQEASKKSDTSISTTTPVRSSETEPEENGDHDNSKDGETSPQ